MLGHFDVYFYEHLGKIMRKSSPLELLRENLHPLGEPHLGMTLERNFMQLYLYLLTRNHMMQESMRLAQAQSMLPNGDVKVKPEM